MQEKLYSKKISILIPTMIPRRLINIDRIKKEFNFKKCTNYKTGLKKTIQWYKNKNDNNKISF